MRKKGKYNQKNQEDEGKKKNFIITEEHLMDKTHMLSTQYLPLLPQDSLYSPYQPSEETELVLRLTLKQLNYILYVDFKVFWATILYNPSFKICIHSCIQHFHRKWLNQYLLNESAVENENAKVYDQIKFTPAFEYTQSLMKVVLLIYHRILHCSEENIQLSNLYRLKQEIIKKYIIDVPRLFEIIEIYGETNPDIVKIIVKQYTQLSNSLYSDFIQQIMRPMIEKASKNLLMIKKTSDREQFGIQYSFNRTVNNELSIGEQQLKKKIQLLMSIVSFYSTIRNIQDYFPASWAEYPSFNVQIHSLSENLFIEIQQAYKIWCVQECRGFVHNYMNKILKQIINFFVDFLEKSNNIFIKKTVKSNFKDAYMKCMDRMIEHYGRRSSVGKKASMQKRYMDLYKQINKIFKIDEFTSGLYREEEQNNTYGINMEFLIDFKIAIDEMIAHQEGRPAQLAQYQQQDKTDIDLSEKQEIRDIDDGQILEQGKKKIQQAKEKESKLKQEQKQQIQKLERLVSKRDRQQDYYQKISKNYKTKINIQYDDEYDDLVDYEKRPMFEDNDKEQQDSSDGSSGEQFDNQVEQLHLVKSNSNVARARGYGVKHQQHEKYDRKNKAKFVPVLEAERNAVINKYSKEGKPKERPNYSQKGADPKIKKETEGKDFSNQKQERQENSKGVSCKNSQYNDEQCYQQSRQKNKEEKIERQKQERNRKEKKVEADFDDQPSDNNNKGNSKKGGKPYNYKNYNNKNDKPKGTNSNKTKWVQKNS